MGMRKLLNNACTFYRLFLYRSEPLFSIFICHSFDNKNNKTLSGYIQAFDFRSNATASDTPSSLLRR